MTACARTKTLNPTDEWVRPTLLGMAFDAGDVAAAETLADDIEAEGPARWKLDTTLADLEVSMRVCPQAETRAGLGAVLDRLKAFI